MITILGCVTQQHNPWLMAIAALLSGLACLTACMVLPRAQAASGRARAGWLVLSAVEFGGGVWSLHLVAMLAYLPDVPPHELINYSLFEIVLSIAFALGGAFTGFALMLHEPRNDSRRILVLAGASALLTAAVAGTHYAGVMAMRASGTFVLDHEAIASSILSCAVLMAVAVSIMRDLRDVRRQLAASVALGLAVCTLHFTAMATLTPVPGLDRPADAGDLGAVPLVVSIAGLNLATLLVTLFLSMSDRRSAARVALEQGRLTQLVDLSFEGLVIERDGVVLDVNGRVCELTGQRPAALVGQPFDKLVPHEEAGERPSRARDRYVCHRDGHAVPVELLTRTIEYGGSPAQAIALRDLTHRRRSEAALHRLAHFDSLTGLPNRSLLIGRLADSLADAGPDGTVAVLCLDLDRFKPVNDTLGHTAGDKLLAAVADRLNGLVRGTDTLARMGGDEFVIVLPSPDGVAAIAVALASRIVARLAEPFGIEGQQVSVGVSAGIALYPDDGITGDELLRCADIAMYAAKNDGRNTFRLFRTEMDEQLQDRRALERDLREAIHHRELKLHYQPLVNCASGAIEGYEALLRWDHPTRGAVPPSVFIPVAEETSLILPLGRWVLECACKAAASWAAPLRVAVNLSPAQFRQPGLAEQIIATLDQTGLAPERLELELTEGVLIDDPDRAITLLSTLRRAGVRVSLDDFGTGFSSLSYIRRFPLDKIKIDKSFIAGMDTDRQAASIVQSLVALAHTLNLTVTAEGVETMAQLDALRLHSCNQVQGFLLGHPAPNPGGTPGAVADGEPEPEYEWA